MTFHNKLDKVVGKNNSLLCVGLDPDVSKMPTQFKKSKQPLFDFNKAIIDATASLVCAFKPQSAFYEAYGPEGIKQLKQTADYIHKKYPHIPIILDAKRADIGNTNDGYVEFIFDYLRMDAVTLHPYLGGEALGPFLNRKDKGLIILCRTSNPGAAEFQDLQTGGRPLYEQVAQTVADKWNAHKNCLLVVGATYPEEMKAIRQIVGPDMVLLVPGIGAQGGDVGSAVRAGLGASQRGMIISSSRDILYASNKADFAKVAHQRARAVRDEINKYREESETRQALEAKGCIYSGHFVGVSTKHLSGYCNIDPLLPHAGLVGELIEKLVNEFKDSGVETVAAPAVGAIPFAHWGAHHLMKLNGGEVYGVWADKVADAPTREFVFEREGFAKLVKGKKILVLEDMINQMTSIRAMIKTVRAAGGKIVGVGAVAANKGVDAKALGVSKFVKLCSVEYDAWTAEDCAKTGLCAQGVPIVIDIGHGDDFQKANPSYAGGYINLLA